MVKISNMAAATDDKHTESVASVEISNQSISDSSDHETVGGGDYGSKSPKSPAVKKRKLDKKAKTMVLPGTGAKKKKKKIQKTGSSLRVPTPEPVPEDPERTKDMYDEVKDAPDEALLAWQRQLKVNRFMTNLSVKQ